MEQIANLGNVKMIVQIMENVYKTELAYVKKDLLDLIVQEVIYEIIYYH